MAEDSSESVLDTGDGLHPLPQEVVSELYAKGACKPEMMGPLPLHKGLWDQEAEAKLIQGPGDKGQHSQ